MFAAAQKKQESLDLFELALGLLSEPNAVIQGSLKTYSMNVIEQAKRMSTNAQSPGANILPEAIALAVYMRRNAELSREILEITDFDSIDATVAKRLLGHLGYNVPHQD